MPSTQRRRAYTGLLPGLFELQIRNVYVAIACEKDPASVPHIIKPSIEPQQRVFIGVAAPIDLRIESPEEVADHVLQASSDVLIERLRTAVDCGFAPFCDDTSTSRDTAFARIGSGVHGAAPAGERLWTS